MKKNEIKKDPIRDFFISLISNVKENKNYYLIGLAVLVVAIPTIIILTAEKDYQEHRVFESKLERLTASFDADGVEIFQLESFAPSADFSRNTPALKFIEDVSNILRVPESYTDLNKNGKWDEGEDFTDCNETGSICDGDAEWTPDKGNGKWDEGEKFTDLNGNGKWDATEPEPFTDCNKKGTICDGDEGWDAAMGNSKWDDSLSPQDKIKKMEALDVSNIDSEPILSRFYQLYGSLLLDNEQPDLAIEKYIKASKIYSDRGFYDASLNLDLSRAYFKKRDISNAETHINQAIECEFDNTDLRNSIFFLKGQILSEK